MTAIVDSKTCTGCGECVEACPLESITLENDIAVVDEETCSDCGSCTDVCPTESITLE